MPDAIVTIRGNSDEAVAALDSTAKATRDLDTALKSLDASTEQLGDSGDKVGRSLSSIAGKSRLFGKSVAQSGNSIRGLGAALSTLNPQVGGLLSAVSSLGGGIGGLTALLNPMTIGLTAATAAIAYGTKKYKEHKKAVEDAAKAQAEYKREIEATYQANLKYLAQIPNISAALAAFADENDHLREVMERQRLDRLNADLERTGELWERETTKVLRLADAYAETERRIDDLRRSRSRLNAADTEKVNREIVDLEASQRKLTAQMRNASEAAEQYGVAFDGVRDGLRLTGKSADDTTESLHRLARVEPDVLKLALAADGLAGALALVASTDPDLGVVDSFARMSNEALRAVGATDELIDKIRELDFAQMSGSEQLSTLADQRLDALQAQADLERQIAEDKAAFEREAAAAAEAAIQLQLDGDQQRADAAAQALADAEAYRDKMVDALAPISNGVADLATAFGEAAVSGEAMGDAVGKAALKGLGDIASNYGAVMMAQGLGMTFTPGMQANGIGLIAAGTALTVLGGALGGVAKGGGGKSSGSGAAQAPRGPEQNYDVVPMWSDGRTQGVSTGFGARDYGAEQDNGTRYGIDRGRAWA